MEALRTTLAALLLAGVPVAHATPEEPPQAARPRLALALSGGGARGIAHIGALRALEEAGLRVDAIAGNSMGAVVGSIYAAGRTTAELEQIVRSLDWQSLFSGRPDRRNLPITRHQDKYGPFAGLNFDTKGAKLSGGVLAEHRINHFLIEQLAPASFSSSGDFDRLAIPFRCVATAIDNGDRVVLAKGDLARAVRASMSIPVAFPPVDWNGRPVVDGLVVDNLPVGVARDFGAAVVVAVDIGSPDLEPSEYQSAFGVAAQVGNLLTTRRNADFQQEPDVYVRPDLGKHSATDYSDFDVLIAQGHEAMKNAVPEIRRKLAGVAEAPGPRAAAGSGELRLEGAPIREIVVQGNQRMSERLIRRTFKIPLGPPFNLRKGLRAFDKINATGLFEHAWMEFQPVPGGLRIVLRVREVPPNRAEVGLGYNEAEKVRGSIRLRNGNTLGFGEETELLFAASDAETLGRLSLRGDRLFVAGLGYKLGGFLSEDKPRIYKDRDEINRAEFERRGLEARAQVPLERWGLVEAGFLFGDVHTRPRSGLDFLESTDQVRMATAAFTVDSLDDLLWPEAGGRLSAAAQWNLDGLGATREYWRLRVEGRLGRKLGKRVASQLDALLGLSGKAVPIYDYFRLGGPVLVPGYHNEELQGPQALAASASVRYRLVGTLRVFARGGAGAAYVKRGDIDLRDLQWGAGVGAMYPTAAGPLSLEFGVRDGGDTLLSVSFGWK